MKRHKLLNVPSIRRLPSYLQVVKGAAEEGREYISGTYIAQELELEAIQVRKDLALTGIMGKPRLGYPVQELIHAIERFLRWDIDQFACLVGAGNLGQALLGYQELKRHKLHIAAAFDVDPSKIGKMVHGTRIHSLSEFAAVKEQEGFEMAILTVPPEVAQEVAEIIVDHGIKGIWNFTNVKLKLPSHVVVQQEDLSSGYAVLSLKMAKFAR
ncbi:Redox-sensing transcriptional repressor rex [Spirochaeta thermophila DSM 6578]|uniref:Redox-sensing transcriptional repressor Rex n=1 Tax=Winmispira thermophila (strain ATCC 700085 / DSM 6578 / Z-1203) TaxID=869211 RepID=G0GB50_WINT7|nr:redox-sensing transcriptional repressor Rex [Spirochaeta thermophila]AEJ61074.1 Redox-sensing transcriptional repressor rex [Spirochaeta thermophila DSM 6578]